MDALNYGAYIASQFTGERSSDIDSPPYNSPPQVDIEDDKTKKKNRGPKLVVRFGNQGQQGRLGNNTTPLSSPSPGSMSGMAENSMVVMSSPSSGPMSSPPVKRSRGRPRKLNPDGSYATNHVPVTLSNNLKTQQYNRRFFTEHARNLVPELCRHMYKLGWMSGSGGSFTIRQNKQIYITPSGVSKERILPQDLFVLDDHGNLLDCPIQEKRLKMSDNAVVFLSIYSMRNAGSIIHSHSQNAVLVTLLYKDQEFSISNQEMIKGLLKGNSGEHYSNDDTLVIPIIENLPCERDLQQRVTIAMQQYPMSNAVLIRRHGIYVWGDTWQTAKSQAESLDYLFQLALQMHQYGMDPMALPSDEHGITD